MSDTLLLFFLSLTVARLTWLVTRDSFPPIRKVRELVKAKAATHGRDVLTDELGDEVKRGAEYAGRRGRWADLEDLTTCYWCMSMWLTGAVVSVTWIFVDLALPLLWYGAVAALSAAMCAAVDRMNRE